MRLCPAFDAASLSCDACDGGGRGRCEKSLVAGGRDQQGRYFVESAALSPAKRLDHCCCHMLASGGKALLLFFLLLRVWGLCLCVHACAHSCISEEGEGAGLGQNYEESEANMHTHARPPARTHARTYACTHERTHARTHARTRTRTLTHSHTLQEGCRDASLRTRRQLVVLSWERDSCSTSSRASLHTPGRGLNGYVGVPAWRQGRVNEWSRELGRMVVGRAVAPRTQWGGQDPSSRWRYLSASSLPVCVFVSVGGCVRACVRAHACMRAVTDGYR